MPKTGYEKQKAVRANKRAAGMVRLDMWLFPEVRDKTREYGNREQAKAEKARERNAKGT